MSESSRNLQTEIEDAIDLDPVRESETENVIEKEIGRGRETRRGRRRESGNERRRRKEKPRKYNKVLQFHYITAGPQIAFELGLNAPLPNTALKLSNVARF